MASGVLAREWTIVDDLTEVYNIEGQLRKDLLGWIGENYHIEGKGKRVKRLVDLIIDTFLDDDAPLSIGLLAPEGYPEAAELRGGDFYNEDIEKGDIISFTDKALSFGYEIQGRRRYSRRYNLPYKGFKPKSEAETGV